MESIARLGLFGFAYITIYIISNLVASANSGIDGSPFFEIFHGISFLIVTLILGAWIYYTHIRDKDVPRNLKEVLYIFTFVSFFTSVTGFLRYC